jgi:hypothetical protein
VTDATQEWTPEWLDQLLEKADTEQPLKSPFEIICDAHNAALALWGDSEHARGIMEQRKVDKAALAAERERVKEQAGYVEHWFQQSLELRQQLLAAKNALEKIKQRVCGDKIPHWQDDWRTTNSRMWIADQCDAAVKGEAK